MSQDKKIGYTSQGFVYTPSSDSLNADARAASVVFDATAEALLANYRGSDMLKKGDLSKLLANADANKDGIITEAELLKCQALAPYLQLDASDKVKEKISKDVGNKQLEKSFAKFAELLDSNGLIFGVGKQFASKMHLRDMLSGDSADYVKTKILNTPERRVRFIELAKADGFSNEELRKHGLIV
jgi:hypothetical protein